jgi:hypothetical protein
MKFDGRINIALVFAVLLQAGGMFLWAGEAQARLDVLEQSRMMCPDTAVRLARVEEQMIDARRSLARIEQRLDAR